METEIDGHTYKIATIDARSQFHIARRLAPILGRIAPLANLGGEAVLPALASAVGELSDEDADYVLFGALKHVSRKQEQGLGWGPVATGNNIMYSDINMMGMLKLAWEALSFNMAGFFSALPSGLTGESQPQPVR